MAAVVRKRIRDPVALRNCLLEAHRFDAREAVKLGIVDMSAAGDELLGKAVELASSKANFAKAGQVYSMIKEETYNDAAEKLDAGLGVVAKFVKNMSVLAKLKALQGLTDRRPSTMNSPGGRFIGCPRFRVSVQLDAEGLLGTANLAAGMAVVELPGFGASEDLVGMLVVEVHRSVPLGIGEKQPSPHRKFTPSVADQVERRVYNVHDIVWAVRGVQVEANAANERPYWRRYHLDNTYQSCPLF
ncbi:MAG: hypothetical protein BJ554DRAFT_5724 [Olpidium bornovanus]|uniref:Uncharacterized protein n=1 Tax=Olpidium bornovanus TaxID=278681 RepID=A0A8H7ZZS6_9FUNG|nr:MAG: hypothetical protein BJ554DRAFT_5724 [Olpidium bornovanus]